MRIHRHRHRKAKFSIPHFNVNEKITATELRVVHEGKSDVMSRDAALELAQEAGLDADGQADPDAAEQADPTAAAGQGAGACQDGDGGKEAERLARVSYYPLMFTRLLGEGARQEDVTQAQEEEVVAAAVAGEAQLDAGVAAAAVAAAGGGALAEVEGQRLLGGAEWLWQAAESLDQDRRGV